MKHQAFLASTSNHKVKVKDGGGGYLVESWEDEWFAFCVGEFFCFLKKSLFVLLYTFTHFIIYYVLNTK